MLNKMLDSVVVESRARTPVGRLVDLESENTQFDPGMMMAMVLGGKSNHDLTTTMDFRNHQIPYLSLDIINLRCQLVSVNVCPATTTVVIPVLKCKEPAEWVAGGTF